MDEIVSPVAVVDEDKCRRNIRHMVTKAKKAHVAFRPHFKTHQSIAIGKWFREAGTEKIAVSSVIMAEYFATDNWQDIMIAFPVNIREISKINELASRIRIGILIADSHIVESLVQKLTAALDFYIKIDVGSHRTGFSPDVMVPIENTLNQAKANGNLRFKGFVAHAGHTYQTRSLNDVQKIFKEGAGALAKLTNYFRKDYPEIIASWGDTPSCSLMNEFPGIDEIRPGNFVFYDLMQYHLASCDWNHIAMVVAAPVVARHPERNEIVLYGGAVHLSKDFIDLDDEQLIYGECVKFTERGWERFSKPVYVKRLSQEHGIVACPEEYFDDFCPGSLIGVVPVHSCLAADLIGRYYEITEGKFLEA
ncbi:MAG: alanine racemase [Bacteroidetes bacterium]|nr:MAG: alanine racemase [Bacteroidota bacterium]